MPLNPPEPPTPAGVNCYQCRHFAVSWDPALPYACRLMGFKSRVLPAIEVLRADGVRCRGFSSKSEAAAQSAGVHTLASAAASLPASPAMPPAASPAPACDDDAFELPDLRALRRLSAFRRQA